MSAGQIHVSKYGCIPILEVCRQFMSPGHAAADSAKHMKRELDRNSLSESKLYAVDSSRNKEYVISFRDKSLYYIITPLVAAGAAQAAVNADGNRLRLSVKDNSFQRDYKTANAIIETEIRKFR